MDFQGFQVPMACRECLVFLGPRDRRELEDANYYGLRTVMNVGKRTSYESILRMVDMSILELIIHQIFSLTRDSSKRVTWANIPQLKLGNI